MEKSVADESASEVLQTHVQHRNTMYSTWRRTQDYVLYIVQPHRSYLYTSAKINISYSILFNLTTSYSSYFWGKKGMSRNKTSFFLLMQYDYLALIWPDPSVSHSQSLSAEILAG